jgi:hypothetical protein
MLPKADRANPAAAYGKRMGGYCDGAVFDAHVGSGELAVVGITRGTVRGKVPFELRTRPDAIPVGASKPVRVLSLQGVARNSAVNYRLDGIIELGGSLIIGTDSASAKFSPPLLPEAITWKAWEDTPDQGRIYHPVFISSAGSAPIAVDVRPTIRTNYVAYTVADDGGGQPVVSTSIPGTDEGAIASFTLPPIKSAVIIVTVTAVGSGGRTQSAVIRIHPPS